MGRFEIFLVALVVAKSSAASHEAATSPNADMDAKVHTSHTASVAYYVDTTVPGTPWTHFFAKSVGSGHIALSARDDYRRHLTMAAKDCGFKYVRGHGLLDDDMDLSLGPGKMSFYNVDSFVDFLLSIGMKPIFELSYMPSWLASGNTTVLHYKGNPNPPKSYSQWQDMIQSLAQHMVDRYGLDVASEFYFECWNEPNAWSWSGTLDQYLKLYQYTVWALKNVSSRLQVGGPATSSPDLYVREFTDFTKKAHLPYDFLSSHAYGSCGNPLGDVNHWFRDPTDKTSGNMFNNTRGIIGAEKPWLITEFGATCVPGDGEVYSLGTAYHDFVDQAGYVVAIIDRLADAPGNLKEPQALSYWAFSDVFEESFFPVHNESFHGGFGLINLHDIPKPTYRAYQLLHETGDLRFQGKRTASTSDLCAKNTGIIAVKNGSSVDVIAYNHAAYGDSIETCVASVVLNGAHSGAAAATVRRIDEDNANPLRTWVELGAPDYTTAAQNAAMLQSSLLKTEQLPLTNSATGLQFSLSLPPHSVAAVRILGVQSVYV